MVCANTLCCHSIFMIFCVQWTVTDAFNVNGSFVLENDTLVPLEDLDSGSAVNLTFDIVIELKKNFEQLVIAVYGNSLKFSNQSSTDGEVIWTLNNTATGVVYGNILEGCNVSSSPAKMNGSENHCYDQDDVNTSVDFVNGTKTKWLLNMTNGKQPSDFTFTGSFAMEVADGVTHGSLIRGLIEVWTVENNNATRPHIFPSNYVIIPPADIEITAQSSLTLPILGTLTTNIQISTYRDFLDVEVGCLTPYENVSNEVILTVQGMVVSTALSSGITANTSERLEKVKAALVSTIGSYQNNQATLTLENVPRNTSTSAPMIITVAFTVRVEDYSQLQDGDVWPVLMSVSFQGNYIWNGDLSVTLDAPAERKPSLRTEIAQSEQCPYDGQTSVTMTTLVLHDSTSTATAYNVTLNIYLPPYVAMATNTYSEPKENTITVAQLGPVVRAEIARLTFSDPFLMTLTLDLDLDERQTLEATHRVVTAEAIYNDRWGNLTELLTETAYTLLYVDKPCAKRIRWDKTGVCINGACPCPAGLAATRCAPCDEMWRCTRYVQDPHFEQISKLKARKITCEASARRHAGATRVSCYRELKNPKRFLEFSPRLGVITGQDELTGFYYGIANNGLAHLISKDYGLTWAPIEASQYTAATTSSSFQWATFL